MCNKEAEYGCVVHLDATNYRPLQGNGADSGDVGREKLVLQSHNRGYRDTILCTLLIIIC